MKKQFQSKAVPRGTRTIWRYLSALILLFSLSIGQMWGAVYATYSVSDLTYTSATLTYEKSGLSGDDQKLKKGERKVEVPCASASGTLYLSGTSGNADRYASIYGSNGTAYDADRQIAMTSGYNSTGIAFTSADILTEGDKYYIVFSSINGSTNYDYKINAFKYVLSSACSSGGDTEAPTLSGSVPANSATDVAVEGTIVLTFSEAIASVDGSKFTLDGATKGTVAIDGTDAKKVNVPYSGAANSATVTLSVAAEAVADAAGNKSAALSDIAFTTVAAITPVCPSGISISGTAAYTEGETISLTAALSEGNGEISYQWYKGSIGSGNEVGTNSNVLTIASCATGDAGDYFCVASKDACSDATSSAYAITVAAVSYCAELYPATSGASPTAKNEELLLQSASYGGKIYTAGCKSSWSESFTYGANGLSLNKGGADSARVELNHLMQAGTVIYAKLVNPDASKARGYKLLTNTGSTKATWQATSTDPQEYTYTVTAGDGLEGNNVFRLQRAESSALKELKVSNCGAELFALSSAVSPAHDPAYATVTLSKNLVAAGGSATATYSDIDAAYEFDGWEITSGDATIADATAATAAITMGTTASTITLKLKAAEVKKTVTYYDNTTELGTELVVIGENPTATGIVAPHKLGYSFAGWCTTNGGAVVALNTISVAADMPLYAVYNAVNCSALSGTIFSLILNNAPAANCTIKNASGFDQEADLIKYGTVSGGIALAKNSSSNNHIVITTDPKLRLLGGSGKVHIQFDCALQEGDKIRTTIENQNISYTTTDVRSTTNNFVKGTAKEVTITKDHVLENATEIYLWSASSSDGKLISFEVIRPEKFEVTFNMHDHGDAVAKQYILDGGKVTKPTDPTASGWDFDGWFKESTYDNEWDFDNDVVNAATEIHAKWTEHVASSDATLKDLTVGGVTVAGFDPATEEYYVVLEMGTTTAPTVSGTANDDNVKSVVIMQTDDPTDDATITVTAEDNTTKVYTVHFSVATSKDIQLVFKTGTTPCVGSASTSTQILSNNAAVSTYIKQITFTNVEGAGDDGAEGSSLNVGKKAGNMFTLSAKAGYAFQAMNFLAKIQDATCEYSINGGAWTELASTNTGGDECYAPFTSGTVHEFRLRSTGNQGVWIRNMQLTMIEACTPIVVAWDEEPVEFEVGKSGYTIAATANNGGTVSYSSESAAVVDVVAATGALTISGLGSATMKAATAEGDGTTYCANGGENIEISKAVNTYYLVKFDAQNGDAADEVKYYSGDADIALPAAPTYPGFIFQGWFDATTGGNQYTAAIAPAASITVYAQWVAQCPGATITTQPVGASYLTGRTPAALVCEATAGEAGALSYEWFTCDDELKTNPVAATATPSTAVAGTFYYFCKVMEAGCDVEAYSEVVTITVADKDPIYLAWVDVTGQNAVALDASKSLYAPEVSAAGIKNSSTYGGKTGYKFNSAPGYIAIEGAPFKEGDIVEMFVTTVTADKARVFNANEAVAANVVAEGAANMVQGANKVALTADANNLYLRRGNDFDGWNPYVAYVAVYRVCAPMLNKVTVAGVDGTPDNTNHIAIEVPFSTTDDALDAIVYDWVSNDAAWTAAHAPAVANAWEWGVENTVTFTDKDGDASVYYVTISKAVPSADATLSALTVNGQAIALADGVFEYSFELPYGTTVAPTVAATPNHVAAVATVDPCTLSGATITVVPESGAGDQQVYTLTFTISAWKEVVIWDGSNMTAVKTVEAEDIASWAVNGFGSISNYNTTCGEKSYTKVLPSGGSVSASRNITLTVPAGYVAKFYVVMASHSDGSERGMFIGSNLVKDPDATSVLELSNNDRDIAVAGMSEIVGAGTWYINPNASIDFQEIRAYVRKGMVRNSMLGDGVLGTSCVDHNVAIEDIQGATFYELMGRDYSNYGKLAFDEIVSGELQAGVPYVFQAHGDKLILFYGETKVDEPVDQNGMYGTFVDQTLTELDGIYYFAQRALWSCADLTSLTFPANRAYVKLSEVGEVPSSTPAPGRRRVTMTVNGEKVTTDVESVGDGLQVTDTQKVLINGQLFILCGDKMFDATGRLVK